MNQHVTEQRVHVWKIGDSWKGGPMMRTHELMPLVRPPGAESDWRMVAVVPQPDDFVTIYWQREPVRDESP